MTHPILRPLAALMFAGLVFLALHAVVRGELPTVTAVLETPSALPGQPGSVLLENRASPITGTADFYAWGLESKKAPNTAGRVDLHAAGAQSLANGEVVIFAITTRKAWSTASGEEFNVVVDNNLDGEPDFLVFSFDFGRLVTGAFDGRIGTFVLDLVTGAQSVYFLAYAPTDGSSILMPIPTAAIGVTPNNPRFAYSAGVITFNGRDFDAFESWALFNPFNTAISTGAFEVVNPGDRIHVPFTVNATEWAATPALGLMVVTQDNKNGTTEANLVRVNVR